ncbi:MAG: hypothetical protein FWG69_02035, partial [Oscillospiraceae bacterium]|nr:hypothetical protein [Oscillospiraceae bacterium]
MSIIVSQINLFDYNEIEKLGDFERLDLAFDRIDLLENHFATYERKISRHTVLIYPQISLIFS